MQAPRAPASPALLFVLTCAMGVGPLLNYGLATVSPLVIRELRITEGQFGMLITAIFASAALSGAWLGRLSDRISNRAQFILIFAGAALAMLVAALSRNYLVLLAAAILAGPPQSISNPTTNRIISREVEPARRPGWIGIKQSGVQATQLFAGLFFPAVAIWVGWQGSLGLGAVVAAGLLVYGLRHLPQSELAPRPAIPVPDAARKPAAGDGRLPASVWLFAAYAGLSGLCMQVTNMYLPLFAVRELGLTLVMGGVAAGMAGVVGVASRILWGRQMARGVPASTLLAGLGVGAFLSAVALWAAGETGAAALLWLAVILHGATVMGTNVVVMAGVMKVVPAARVGAATGFVATLMYGGFAIGPLLMGILIERTHGFLAGWVLIGVGYLLCVLLARMLRGRAGRGA